MIQANQDPYSLAAAFQSGPDGGEPSQISSISEPAPGEPLSPESEELLNGLSPVGSDTGEDGEPAPEAADLLPPIVFDAEKTEKVLIEIFDWMAERFDSDHWKLTENQVSMLGQPTAQLLGGVWSKLAEKLPDILVNTPGAAAFLLACTIVVVPKAAQQVAISRARRQGKAVGPRKPGPVAVPQSRRPVHASEFNAADAPIAEGAGANDFQVTE